MSVFVAGYEAETSRSVCQLPGGEVSEHWLLPLSLSHTGVELMTSEKRAALAFRAFYVFFSNEFPRPFDIFSFFRFSR